MVCNSTPILGYEEKVAESSANESEVDMADKTF